MYFTATKYYLLLFLSLIFTFNNVYCQNGLKVQSAAILNIPNGSSLFVIGDINLSNNSTLNNSGVITSFKTDLHTANFIDSNTTLYNYGVGKFIFTGTDSQIINSTNQFEQIEVSNNINLASNVKANVWHLNSGKVNTGSFMAIATSSSESAVIASSTNINFSSCWVNGNLQRSIIPTSVNNYQFPVGDASKVKLLEMDNLTLNPLVGVSSITASFGPKPGNDVGLNVTELSTPYYAVNNGGVWYLTPNANPTSGKYDLKLYFNGFTGLANNSFGILRRPDASATAIEWQIPAGGTLPIANTAGRMTSDGFARRNNITTFSQLGIGMSLVPLPLQLLNFYAVKKDKTVLLQWSTANETNTSHFEIFRGVQTTSLQYLAKVTANGVLTNNNYSYTDVNPLDGINFYQLKIFDKSSSFKVSPTAKVNFNKESLLTVYPNPIIGNILLVECGDNKNINAVKLITVDGKQVSCNFTRQLNSQINIILPTAIAKGIYTLQLYQTAGESLSTKILIQ